MKKPIKKIALIVIALGIVSCLILAFNPYHIGKSFQPKTMSLIVKSTNQCSPWYNEVLDTKWNDQGVLTIQTVDTAVCEYYHWQGSYSVDGNDLILYVYPGGSSASACLCYYYLTFKISGLEQKEYNITIKGNE
jgi:hypothetical protein